MLFEKTALEPARTMALRKIVREEPGKKLLEWLMPDCYVKVVRYEREALGERGEVVAVPGAIQSIKVMRRENHALVFKCQSMAKLVRLACLQAEKWLNMQEFITVDEERQILDGVSYDEIIMSPC